MFLIRPELAAAMPSPFRSLPRAGFSIFPSFRPFVAGLLYALLCLVVANLARAHTPDVSTGEYHTLFLKSDGSVWGSGLNYEGQLGDGSTLERSPPVLIMENAVAISAGYKHSLFLKADGSAWTCGANDSGQLGDGTTTDRSTPVQVMTGVVAISAGNWHSLFLKADGSVWGAGHNYFGQLANPLPFRFDRATEPLQIMTGVTAISAGAYHSLFLKTDGSVWACGSNSNGQLGDGTLIQRIDPVRVMDNARAISAGNYHSLFVKNDHSAWVSGDALAFGQGDPNFTSSSYKLTPVPLTTDVSQVSAGLHHNLFLKTDGSVWASGYNSHSGALGNGSTDYEAEPVKIAEGAVAIEAGKQRSFFVKADGSHWAAGDNSYGQLGDGYLRGRSPPGKIMDAVAAVYASHFGSFFLKSDGSAWACGDNYRGVLGDGSATDQPSPVLVMNEVAAIYPAYRTCFLKTDGSLWITAAPSGSPDDENRAAPGPPTQIATDVTQVSSGYLHTLFTKTDGTLWGLGGNYEGQLGDGSTTSRDTPVLIATRVAHISAGDSHSLFIKTDGSLWAMGRNHKGQLGDGSTTDRSTPVHIATDVAQVAAGPEHTLFIKTDASLWGNGSSYHGELGHLDGYNKTTPILIATGVATVRIRERHAVFHKTDGTVWSMGNSSYLSTPHQMPTDVAHFAIGGLQSAFLKPDGSLWIAERPQDYEVGDEGAPVLVMDGVTAVSSGYAHVLFIKTDGSAWSCGKNQFGQLGLGSASEHLSPVRVGAQEPADQSIYFPPIADRDLTALELPLFASASSRLPVILTLIDGPATLTNGILTLNSPGTVTVRASQAGGFGFAAAPPIERSFRLSLPYAQSINFPAPNEPCFGDRPFPLTATANSGLPVVFEVVAGPASFSDGLLTVTDVGTVIVRASQSGDATYAPAAPVERSFVVRQAEYVSITLSDLTPYYTGQSLQPTATTTPPGLNVTFKFINHDQNVFFPDPGTRFSSGLVIIGPPWIVYDPVHAEPGTYTVRAEINDPRVVYGDLASETFTILKAPLTIRPAPAVRLPGQRNPPVSLIYTHPTLGDIPAPVLDTAPTVRTRANRASGPGDYPITISRAADDHYDFIYAPGTLSVITYGGAYEALVEDETGTPVGKLTLTIPSASLTFTGSLSLAAEAAPIPVRGAWVFPEDFSSAACTFSRPASPRTGLPALALSLTLFPGTLAGTLTRAEAGLGTLAQGVRLARPPVPRGTGTHTLTLAPAFALDEDDTRALPGGFGHATATISETGVLTLSGKLADGSALTASLKPAPDRTYRLWINPHAKRPDSFLAGRLALQPHPDDTRFPGRFFIPTNDVFVTWQKAARLETAASAKPGKAYPAGFGPIALPVSLDPWLPPVTRSTTGQPAVTLPQRLGLAGTNVASGEIAVSHATLDEGTYPLPVTATLTPAGKLLVGTPNDTKWRVSSLNPATGAFSGSFVLTDYTPDKTAKRRVPFSGTLRQPTGGEPLVGAGFFLLPALPGAESDEWISGELRFTVP